MRTVEILKNFKDGNQYRLKGQVLVVMPWKAEELIKKEQAKLVDKPEQRKIYTR